jgi:hypothetical protein
MLHYYCLAHEPLRFPPDPRIIVVNLGRKGARLAPDDNTTLHAYDLVDDLAHLHRWLGGSLGNFAVLQHLKDTGAAPTDRVCISHYRRFLSPVKFGVESLAEPEIRAISTAACARLDVYDSASNHPEPFLTAQPWNHGFGEGLSLRDQYARVHHLPDLERYTELAIELGATDPTSIKNAFDGKKFFPGGIEFTMCPVSVYLDRVGCLERLCRAYLERYNPVRRSDYQDRFLCYCNERLGSMFLEAELGLIGASKANCYGFMHTVSDTQEIEPGNWQPSDDN